MQIDFLNPRNARLSAVDWKVSEQSRAIVKYYAEYTEYTENHVVDMFFKELLKDDKFLEWVKSRRFNKRILNQLLLQTLINEDTPVSEDQLSKSDSSIGLQSESPETWEEQDIG